MDYGTFRAGAAGARKQLNQRLKDAKNRITTLEKDIEAAHKELAVVAAQVKSLDAFEAAAAEVPAPRASRSGEPQPPAKKGKRRRRGSQRARILAVIREAGSAGVGRGGIIQRLGIKDKSGQQAVSNALAALKKAAAVRHDKKAGLYTVAGDAGAGVGDGASAPPAAAKRAGPSPGDSRKSPRRRKIEDIIRKAGAAGVDRGGIVAQLRMGGDSVQGKSAQQSVSNALAALKKSGEVSHVNRVYSAAT